MIQGTAHKEMITRVWENTRSHMITNFGSSHMTLSPEVKSHDHTKVQINSCQGMVVEGNHNAQRQGTEPGQRIRDLKQI